LVVDHGKNRKFPVLIWFIVGVFLVAGFWLDSGNYSPMRSETWLLKYARELEMAKELVRSKPNLSAGRLARELRVSRYVAERILDEVSVSGVLQDPLDQLRNVLVEPSACDWKSLLKASGVPKHLLRRMLNWLPDDDPALRAFRARRRAARSELRKEREKELASKLEEHLRQGGSLQSFADREKFSPTKVRGLFYRNLSHLDYANSRLLNATGRMEIESLIPADSADARKREARIESLKRREKDLASTLKEHVQQGGSFRSFARREGISCPRVSRIFYRNFGDLNHGPSGEADRVRWARIEQVCRLDKEGLRAADIAERLGMKRSAVYTIIHRYQGVDRNIERPPRVSVVEQRAEEKRVRKRKELLELVQRAKELLKEGFPLTEIAAKLGVSYYALYFRLRVAKKFDQAGSSENSSPVGNNGTSGDLRDV
jgi:AraC-like DNA-binding protein